MSKLFLILLLLFQFKPSSLIAQYADPEDARNYLLQGVKKVSTPGTSGPLILTKETAFPVFTVGELQSTAIAAAYMGNGAVVAFGNSGFFIPKGFESDDTGKFLENAIRWTSGNESPKVLTYNNDKLAQYLLSRGLNVTQNKGTELTIDFLANYDVYIVDPGKENSDEIANLKSFVKSGNGLIVGSLGWAWKQLNQGKSMQDMRANILLKEAGIVWVDGYVDNNYLAKNKVSPYANTSKAIQLIKSKSMNTVDKQSYGQALFTLMRTLPYLSVSPFAIEANFPGKVNENVERISKRLSIKTDIPRWHSSGLYAAPGEEINITIPESLKNKGYAVRIGAHTDWNYKLANWKRHPDITVSYPLEHIVSKVFNPFGGLIYIEVPEKQKLGEVEIVISGGVKAPHFVLGKTDVDEWRETIRYLPVPWAELEGKEFVITLQSDQIRNLDNPNEVIQYWDKAQANNRKLAVWDEKKNRPMRIVFDTQIRIGYLHSGYPMMSSITENGKEQESILNIKKDSDHWGFFHELGHNHQHSDWTFDGTGEVTCNLFSLYNLVHLQGKPRLLGHDQEIEKQNMKRHFDAGSPYDKWKSDPTLALHMYDQLIGAYGWQVLEVVFLNYSRLKKEERPKNNQEKIDLWLTMYSFTLGENLSAFFDKWGIPVSEKAKQEISHLPEADLQVLLSNVYGE